MYNVEDHLLCNQVHIPPPPSAPCLEVRADEGPQDIRLILEIHHHVGLLQPDGRRRLGLFVHRQVLGVAQAQPRQRLDRLGLRRGEEHGLALAREVGQDGVERRREALRGGGIVRARREVENC